jgi:hypothetical protein
MQIILKNPLVIISDIMEPSFQPLILNCEIFLFREWNNRRGFFFSSSPVPASPWSPKMRESTASTDRES